MLPKGTECPQRHVKAAPSSAVTEAVAKTEAPVATESGTKAEATPAADAGTKVDVTAASGSEKSSSEPTAEEPVTAKAPS